MDITNANGGPAAAAGGAGSPAAASPAASPAAPASAGAPGAPAAPGTPAAALFGAAPGGTGGLSVGTPVLDVKVNAVVPSSTAGMDANSVMDILHNLDVEGVREAALAHTALGQTLERIAENLMAHGHTLASGWQGDSAQAAITKFQQMHAQTSQIAAQARQTGQVLEWTAGIMDQYRNLPHPLGGPVTGTVAADAPGSAIGDVVAAASKAVAPGAAHQALANAQAQKYLNELNQHLVTANGSLPSSIGHSPALSSPGAAPGTGGAGGPARTVTAAGGPASGGAFTGTVAPAGGVSGAPAPTFTPAQHSVPVPSARLQSATAPVAPAAPAAPAPAAPVSAPVPTFVPAPAAPAASGPPAPDEATLGSTTEEDPSEDSALAAAEGGEAEGSSSTIGDRKQNSEAGEGAMPMMGGGAAGQSEQERLRESWMNEERNIWGVPGDTGTVHAEIGDL